MRRRDRRTIVKNMTPLERAVELALVNNRQHNIDNPKRKWTLNKKKLRRVLRNTKPRG